MTSDPNKAADRPSIDGDGPEPERVLMRFGPAPNLIAALGGIVGGVAMAVFQGPGLLAIVGGVVMGLGAGWLFGLILAMAFLGE